VRGELERRKPTFNLDLSGIIRRMKSLPISVDAKVKVSIPFLEVTFTPDDRECKIAREVVIRLADRRVLNSKECCDGCIDNAITSLKEIREVLVDKQVEFSDKSDTALYILLDSIREAIRQFMTFEQRLGGRHKEEHRNYEERQVYFDSLEMLRAHIYRTLMQLAKIGNCENLPALSQMMYYDDQWQLEVYIFPRLEED
jgi:hypothetical protein